jgi:histidine triad (HIT) family protein
MPECIFCKIVRQEIPSSKIFEDRHVLAFLDISPVNKGHTLVIPKEHAQTLMDVTDKTLQHMIIVAKKVSAAIMKSVNAEGISISMSNHPAAGQVVPHAHIHIIPRYTSDGLKLWPQKAYEEGEMSDVQNKILKNI